MKSRDTSFEESFFESGMEKQGTKDNQDLQIKNVEFPMTIANEENYRRFRR
jgi:hypothetical protein